TAAEQKLAPVIAEHNLYRKAIAGRSVPPEQLQEALHSDELFLEYVLSEPVSFCLAITKTTITLVPLASENRIDSVADHYLREVRAQNSWIHDRKQLYSLVMDSLGTERVSRIVIVPDGNLHLLPFDSFIDNNGNSLVESHVVSYAPSATAFFLLRTLPE